MNQAPVIQVQTVSFPGGKIQNLSEFLFHVHVLTTVGASRLEQIPQMNF